jgi:hypothetical protein
MKFILASGTSHRSLEVNWWRRGDIQARRIAAIFRARMRAARPLREHARPFAPLEKSLTRCGKL